jgi:hypothetical protein
LTIQKLSDFIGKLNEEGQKLCFSGTTARQAKNPSTSDGELSLVGDVKGRVLVDGFCFAKHQRHNSSDLDNPSYATDKVKFPTISKVVHGENAHLTLDTGDDAPCSGNDSYCPDHDDISHQGAIEDILGLVFGQMLAAFDGSSVPVNNELKELTEPLYEADGDLSSAREIRIQSIQAVHGSVYARAYLHSYMRYC